MASNSVAVSTADNAILKETLCAQQKLLQELYNELDAERESSATAASEALSVILRLQGEKAAVQMEAEQYKRLVEEKMCHAEESLAIFEDLIYEKEMEVAALDYQVEAYRFKLWSMGCDDLDREEMKDPESLLQPNESVAEDKSLQSLGRKSSATSLAFKYLQQKKGIDGESSNSAETDLMLKIVEENTSLEISEPAPSLEKKTDHSTSHDINSYWEQIQKLDERVKEIAGVSYANHRNHTRSPSPFPQLSAGSISDPAKSANLPSGTQTPCGDRYHVRQADGMNEADPIQHPENLLKNCVTDTSHIPRVHDVFEVPQVDQNCKAYEPQTYDEKGKASQGIQKFENPESVQQEAVKSRAEDEHGWLKELLQSTPSENGLSKPVETAAITCNLAIVKPATNAFETQSKLNEFNRTAEIVEVERVGASQEFNQREEELKLLGEIRDQLNSLQCEIRSWKRKKSSPSTEFSIVSLSEAMLHFWL